MHDELVPEYRWGDTNPHGAESDLDRNSIDRLIGRPLFETKSVSPTRRHTVLRVNMQDGISLHSRRLLKLTELYLYLLKKDRLRPSQTPACRLQQNQPPHTVH